LGVKIGRLSKDPPLSFAQAGLVIGRWVGTPSGRPVWFARYYIREDLHRMLPPQNLPS
jgi:hypothetical protein